MRVADPKSVKPIVSIERLNFSYGSLQILNDINFSINKGDFCVLLGANGSGKSTLLKLLIGELKVYSGTLKIFGKAVNNFTNWHEIGYLSQTFNGEYNRFPASVFEIVSANLYHSTHRFLPLSRAQKEQVYDVLAAVDMLPFARKKFSELSGGQRQRVLLARTLVNKPKLIILDEPTSALDKKSSQVLMQILLTTRAQYDTTILLITHDLQVIPKDARVLELKHGQVSLLDFGYPSL